MNQKIFDEADIEPSNPVGNNALESHLTDGLNPLQVSSRLTDINSSATILKNNDIGKFPVGYNFLGKEKNRVVGGVGEKIGQEVGGGPKADVKHPLEKINSLEQKERAMFLAGVTRLKTYRAIAQLLDAQKWIDVYDVQGNIKRELVPDVEKNVKGAELALRAFGDLIERKEIEYDVGDKTLEKFRGMSVHELKARAADILLGKNCKVVDAEVIRG